MRYALTDSEWNTIQPILPSKPRGIPRVDDRRVINGILWVLRSGAPWRDLPDRMPPTRPATIASSVGGGLASGTPTQVWRQFYVPQSSDRWCHPNRLRPPPSRDRGFTNYLSLRHAYRVSPSRFRLSAGLPLSATALVPAVPLPTHL